MENTLIGSFWSRHSAKAVASMTCRLREMAFALCRDQKLPIKVFSIVKPGALKRVILGEDEGTLVHV